MSNYIIGIDLGTCNSCCAVYRNNQVEIISDSFTGDNIIPSYVAFTNDEILIGSDAKNQINYNSSNTVYDCKRLIGRKFTDLDVQRDLKYFPFSVISDNNNNPLICIDYHNNQDQDNLKKYKPEEISSMILSKLKTMAQSYLGETITNAVVTIPAYFNNQQRENTMIALQLAGLNCIRIINEPTAAAIAYGLDQIQDKTDKTEKYILVVDLGGGTSDITILSMCDGLFQVKATAGNPHLGGEDFDNKIVTWCLKEFYQKNNNKNNNKSIELDKFIKNKKVLSRLKSSCENAKKILSTAQTTNIQIDCLYDGIDFDIQLTRAKFEDLCEDLFKQCNDIITQALREAKLNKNDINSILLAGGSTKIPKIKKLISNYFDNKELFCNINPDEVVVSGAAILGSIISSTNSNNNNENNEKITNTVLIDVNSLSLGIETSNGQMVKVIPKNTPIPTSAEKIFSTFSDNQPSLIIKVYEGEHSTAKQNNLLGEFNLTDIPSMPRGIPRIHVKFEINVNGILTVSATEESSKKSKTIIIKTNIN